MILPQTVDQFCLWFSCLLRLASSCPSAGRCSRCRSPQSFLGSHSGSVAVYCPTSTGREGGIVDSIWLLFGWLPSLLYALALYGLRRCFFSCIVATHCPAPPNNARDRVKTQSISRKSHKCFCKCLMNSTQTPSFREFPHSLARC